MSPSIQHLLDAIELGRQRHRARRMAVVRRGGYAQKPDGRVLLDALVSGALGSSGPVFDPRDASLEEAA
jgi:hypothetical protein